MADANPTVGLAIDKAFKTADLTETQHEQLKKFPGIAIVGIRAGVDARTGEQGRWVIRWGESETIDSLIALLTKRVYQLLKEPDSTETSGRMTVCTVVPSPFCGHAHNAELFEQGMAFVRTNMADSCASGVKNTASPGVVTTIA